MSDIMNRVLSGELTLTEAQEEIVKGIIDKYDGCQHEHTHVQRSNSGDGAKMYDFLTVVCDDCGEELGEPDDD